MAEINIEKMAQNIAQKAIQELRDNGALIGRWIPVSEGLPEKRKEVLTCSLGGFIEIQSAEDGYYGYWENQNGDWSDIDEVVAWCELPEPYKAEGSNEDESS